MVALGPGSVLGRSGSRGGSWSYRRQCSGRRALLSAVHLLRAISLPAVPGRVERLRLGTQLLLRRALPINALEMLPGDGTDGLHNLAVSIQS